MLGCRQQRSRAMPSLKNHFRRYAQVLAGTLLVIALAGSCENPAAAATQGRDPGARCRQIEARIALLQGRLRMGYTARQGRLWRQQLAALESGRRTACR
jgi:hypothetical protein